MSAVDDRQYIPINNKIIPKGKKVISFEDPNAFPNLQKYRSKKLKFD